MKKLLLMLVVSLPLFSSPYVVEGKVVAERKITLSTRKACSQMLAIFKKKYQSNCPGYLPGEQNTRTTRLDFLLCRCAAKNCILRYTANCSDKRESIKGTSITITRNMRYPFIIE